MRSSTIVLRDVAPQAVEQFPAATAEIESWVGRGSLNPGPDRSGSLNGTVLPTVPVRLLHSTVRQRKGFASKFQIDSRPNRDS